MSLEKIAFLFPYNGPTGEKEIPPPLLAYDCEEFPAELDMSAGVFFIGMSRGKPYYLEMQIFRSEDEVDIPVSPAKGMWIRLSDDQKRNDDIAASIDISLIKCKFDHPGAHMLRARLLVENEIIHENKAYFRVSKAL